MLNLPNVHPRPFNKISEYGKSTGQHKSYPGKFAYNSEHSKNVYAVPNPQPHTKH